MSKPYRPSCGTEGLDFQEEFCFRCEKDRAYREIEDGEKGCQILSHTYVYMVSDPRYPKEWVTDEQGPRCTAFEPEKKPGIRKPKGGVYTCLDCGHRGWRQTVRSRCPACGGKATAGNTV